MKILRILFWGYILYLAYFIINTNEARGATYDVKTFVPKKAYIYSPTLKEVIDRIWSDHPAPELLGALIEQESCITLVHKRCWDPTSKLDTKREKGVGLGQTTIAYKEDGTVRFDALKDLRNAHMAELKELSWQNIETRPDLQMRFILLMMKDNYKRLYTIPELFDRYAMTDAAYNGGYGGVIKDRRLCSLSKDCDPNKWFGHVERTCSKSKKPLYGNRSACDINREHVDSVMRKRNVKYKPLLR